MTLLAAALDLAARGFRVFPLVENSKLPAIAGWTERATIDTGQIELWWHRCPVLGWPLQWNIGVLTGAAIGDGFLTVIDIDPKRDGEATWTQLQATRPLHPILAVRTPSGGRHLYFVSPIAMRNSASKLGPGIDVRGYHGYVVGPGSEIDGKRYAIES